MCVQLANVPITGHRGLGTTLRNCTGKIAVPGSIVVNGDDRREDQISPTRTRLGFGTRPGPARPVPTANSASVHFTCKPGHCRAG